MTHENNIYDQLIIGAGVAGITAARELHFSGERNWMLLDKGRSVGGRLATRRIDQHKFDHGAQFFTVRSNEFRQIVDDFIKHGIVKEWCRGFRDISGNVHQDGHPRYAVKGGMNQLTKQLARELPSSSILLEQKIIKLEISGDHWRLSTESNQQWFARDLVLTTPLTQAVELLTGVQLDNGVTSHLEPLISELRAVQYAPCIAIMGVFHADELPPLNIPLQNTNGPISFVSDNGLKGVSERPGALTIHLSGDLSRRLWSNSDQDILREVIPVLQNVLGIHSLTSPMPFQIHRWRYATPQTTIDKPFITWTPPSVPISAPSSAQPRLFIAGEVFQGPKIEGAYLSGLAVGRHLVKHRGDASSFPS